jgi:hypothetical protein
MKRSLGNNIFSVYVILKSWRQTQGSFVENVKNSKNRQCMIIINLVEKRFFLFHLFDLWFFTFILTVLLYCRSTASI